MMKYIVSTGRTDILYRDIIESEETEKQLVTVGGKRQAPSLFIDGKPLYESQDIIDWREAHPQAI